MPTIESGRTHNPVTLWTVPVPVHVQVWVHIPGDPRRNTATTTNPFLIDTATAGSALAAGGCHGETPKHPDDLR